MYSNKNCIYVLRGNICMGCPAISQNKIMCLHVCLYAALKKIQLDGFLPISNKHIN